MTGGSASSFIDWTLVRQRQRENFQRVCPQETDDPIVRTSRSKSPSVGGRRSTSSNNRDIQVVPSQQLRDDLQRSSSSASIVSEEYKPSLQISGGESVSSKALLSQGRSSSTSSVRLSDDRREAAAAKTSEGSNMVVTTTRSESSSNHDTNLRTPEPMKTRSPMIVRMNAGGKMLSCELRLTKMLSIPFASTTDGDLRIYDDQYNLLELIENVWFVKILVSGEPIERIVPIDNDGDDDILLWKFREAIIIEKEIMMYRLPQSKSSEELKLMFAQMITSIERRDKNMSQAYERFRGSYCKLWRQLTKQPHATTKVPRTASTNSRLPRGAKVHPAPSAFYPREIAPSPAAHGRIMGSPRRQR